MMYLSHQTPRESIELFDEGGLLFNITPRLSLVHTSELNTFARNIHFTAI